MAYILWRRDLIVWLWEGWKFSADVFHWVSEGVNE